MKNTKGNRIEAACTALQVHMMTIGKHNYAYANHAWILGRLEALRDHAGYLSSDQLDNEIVMALEAAPDVVRRTYAEEMEK